MPKLKPKAECTTIPKETCQLKFTQPQEVKKTLKTKWCQDPTPAEPGDKYEEGPDTPPVLTASANAPVGSEVELPTYGEEAPPPPPPKQPDTLYGAPPQELRKARQGRRQGGGGGGQRAGRRQQQQQ